MESKNIFFSEIYVISVVVCIFILNILILAFNNILMLSIFVIIEYLIVSIPLKYWLKEVILKC